MPVPFGCYISALSKHSEFKHHNVILNVNKRKKWSWLCSGLWKRQKNSCWAWATLQNQICILNKNSIKCLKLGCVNSCWNIPAKVVLSTCWNMFKSIHIGFFLRLAICRLLNTIQQMLMRFGCRISAIRQTFWVQSP